MERRPHVLAIPFPAQGHVGPLMKLSRQVARRGIRVTFMNTESVHTRMLQAWGDGDRPWGGIEMATIPDGMEEIKDMRDIEKVAEMRVKVMSGRLEELLRKMNSSWDEKVTCVLADATLGWAFEVAEKMGIKRAMFWPTVVPGLVLSISTPRLVEAGVIDNCGSASSDTAIQFSPKLPAVKSVDFLWRCPGDQRREEIIFRHAMSVNKAVQISNWLLCNSFYELDHAACGLIPELLPVGPLTSTDRLGNFWAEDLTCLNWLDLQPCESVIYVAFGSLAAFDQNQFEELALGLELSGHPFLWVVRSGFTNVDEIKYPDGFLERVSDRGKIVSWVPQEKVLAHPSVACFMTHCGWNSIMEGISNGVPFLCWPCFADQFYNRSYICDTLKVGLDLKAEEAEIVSRHKIQAQLEQLLSDVQIKENAERLRGMARRSVSEGGSSSTNIQHFVEQLKCCSEAVYHCD
ncbi:UDP-glycosyltransferase 83A1-like [Rhodamnia argentea]|uniref:UDP-glycosyltransferase 83A1-like n=1 Tax=Rhodamnia argentea TaxID=178133 RepID=A0A8B8PSD2_9MYRT|nr:UDP-glycosyltransferase 83A1-like [Rhodamnia argentea]